MADEDPLILQDNAIAQALYGENDRNLRALEREVGVTIQARGNRIRVKGPNLECKLARRVLQELYDMAADPRQFTNLWLNHAVILLFDCT